jgi:hypothetical protein
LFVYAATVEINNLTIADTVTAGGGGGPECALIAVSGVALTYNSAPAPATSATLPRAAAVGGGG